MKKTVEVRQKLLAEIEEIAEAEEMDTEELLDHILRTYAEEYAFEEDEEN